MTTAEPSRRALDRVVDSVNVRDFDGERDALLRKAEALAAQSAALDVDSAVSQALSSVGAAAEDALQQGGARAEGARARIAEQQERFKAGIVSQGRSLDEELREDEMLSQSRKADDEAPASAIVGNVYGNKYASLMNKKKHEQQKAAEA